MLAFPPPPALRALQLIVTADCNLRCSYCYQNDKKRERMSWDVAQPALDRLLASTRDDVEILFIGGEPLTELPLIRQAVAYLQDHRRSGQRIRHSIITNGTLMGPEEARFFADHGFQINLSFDGVAAAQDFRGRGTFARLDRLLTYLRTEYPALFDQRLKVQMTALPETLAYLPASVEYLLIEKRVERLVIAPQFDETVAWEPGRIDELDAAFAGVFDVCLRRLRETGDVPLELFQHTGGRPRPAGPVKMCGVGRGDQLAVDVDGRTHGCVAFVESYQRFTNPALQSRIESMRLGDLRAPGYEAGRTVFPLAVVSAEIFDHKELKGSSYGQCGTCEYLHECSICPISVGRAPGDDPHRIPDFACAFSLVSLKYRHRFPRVRPLHERLMGPRAPIGVPMPAGTGA
ncbi:MAG: radical SAM protein [Vicinamibacterales bacterium]